MQQGVHYWRRERADRMSVIVDADDYFRTLRTAMLGAKRRIMLVGWDFDARLSLDHEADLLPGEPRHVGGFIRWLVEREPELEIFLLRWDLGAVKSLFRGTTAVTLLRWAAHPRIHARLDGHHPTGASHHQKVVVIDDCLAFCGGIDVTDERWDTRAHRDDEPGRRRGLLRRAYKPWHDATTAISGPAAAALGDMARERWHRATGAAPEPVSGGGACWPDGLDVDFRDAEVAIARTVPDMEGQEAVHESEAMFLHQIAQVRRHLYVESQYFASRRIAEALARRLEDADGPEVVIVNPRSAQGWLEPIAMDSARTRLMRALKARDRHGRLRLYHPVTAGGADIYCHAKVLVADDRVLRLGSSNMNNRSLRLDTECDVALEADDPDARARIAAVRDDLLAEHLGTEASTVAAAVARTGSLIAAVEELRGPAGGGRRTLDPYEDQDQGAVRDWLADNEVLDPEGPDEMFEPLSARGLFRRMRRPR